MTDKVSDRQWEQKEQAGQENQKERNSLLDVHQAYQLDWADAYLWKQENLKS